MIWGLVPSGNYNLGRHRVHSLSHLSSCQAVEVNTFLWHMSLFLWLYVPSLLKSISWCPRNCNCWPNQSTWDERMDCRSWQSVGPFCTALGCYRRVSSDSYSAIDDHIHICQRFNVSGNIQTNNISKF